MARRSYIKLDKITFARWVDKTLDLTFIIIDIMLGFKGIGIWPFNLRAMDLETSFGTLYTL